LINDIVEKMIEYQSIPQNCIIYTLKQNSIYSKSQQKTV